MSHNVTDRSKAVEVCWDVDFCAVCIEHRQWCWGPQKGAGCHLWDHLCRICHKEPHVYARTIHWVRHSTHYILCISSSANLSFMSLNCTLNSNVQIARGRNIFYLQSTYLILSFFWLLLVPGHYDWHSNNACMHSYAILSYLLLEHYFHSYGIWSIL